MKSIFKLSLLFISIICCSKNSFAQEWHEMTLQEPVNVEEVKIKAETYFDTRGRGKHTGYKQYRRWLNNATKSMDENGNLYTSEYIKKELEEFRSNVSNRQQKMLLL